MNRPVVPVRRCLALATAVGLLPAAAASVPAPCDDATFLRRSALDLVGRQPDPRDLEAFLADGAADKRARAIDGMLSEPAWAGTWARYFRDVILSRRADDRALAMAGSLETFLAERLRDDDASWARIAHAMITAVGPPSDRGETAIVMAQMGETADVAAEVSRVFLGIQIQCAQCHDHFTDRWRRRQFHEFAAFFPRIEIVREEGMGLDRFRVASRDEGPRRQGQPAGPRRGRLEHAMPHLDDPSRPGTVMRPTFFLTGDTVPLGTPDLERRRAVADWITSADNPWFARAIVNRLWGELVGTGFYAGIDDIGPDREPREADELDRLCVEFVAAGHDLRVLFRSIMATPAYQSVARSRAEPEAGLAASCPQRLRADQLFAQILAALDADEPGPRPAPRRGGGRMTFAPRAPFIQAFGYDPSLPRDEVAGSIPQSLLLMNSQPLARAIDAARPASALGRLLAEHADDRTLADAIYVRVLARHPSPEELAACLEHVREVGDRGPAFEDVFWALVNGPEFIHRK